MYDMQMLADIILFLQQTFAAQEVKTAVVGVSGGIDSAVVLSLLARALPRAHIFPVLLPYGPQEMADAQLICDWNEILPTNRQIIDIKPVVDQIIIERQVPLSDHLRRGNIMARTRMIMLFDIAKEKQALVVGTENKSEHYLGYFTRFGDAAADVEPISHCYKTQVWALAQELGIPESIVTKAPSAGLWPAQTDEAELGFSYWEADQVLQALVDENIPAAQIKIPGVSDSVVTAVIKRVAQHAFKRQVPYTMTSDRLTAV